MTGGNELAARVDAASEGQARSLFLRCCGATRWAEAMVARRPFGDDVTLFRVADEVWATMQRDDVLEALAAHPQIGEDIEALRRRFADTATWSSGEQAGVGRASEQTLAALRDGNAAYRDKFGHIFVVCATGKSADEMLALLRDRLTNDPATELHIAAAEQAKIIRLRLEKS